MGGQIFRKRCNHDHFMHRWNSEGILDGVCTNMTIHALGGVNTVWCYATVSMSRTWHMVQDWLWKPVPLANSAAPGNENNRLENHP